MSSATISYRPIFRFSPCVPSRFKSPQIISFHEFPRSRPFFFGGFISTRPISERNTFFRSKTMIEPVRTSAFTRTDGDEAAEFIEEEAILGNEPSEFRPGFASGGRETTLNLLSKWLIAGSFGAVILCRHDAEALWAAIGSVVNTCLSVTLKRILNQERPISTLKSSDPGMPSTHAQSIFFIVMFVVLSLFKWMGINELSVIVGVLTLAGGSYLSWLRVSQQYHTVNQVAVGAVLGSVCSVMWCWSWDAIVLKAFISYLWVRVFVVLGGAGVCLAFLMYVIRYWVMDE